MIQEAVWDRKVPVLSDDALMLAESDHRVRNEVAAAIAAMRLILRAKTHSSRWSLLDKAIHRLEAFGDVHKQLSLHPSPTMDLGREIDRLCQSLATGRNCVGTTIDLRVPTTVVDAETGRRVLMIANELITNAIKYAANAHAARIWVRVRVEGQEVILTVADDGPGIAPDASPRGSGLGTPLISELVRRRGGRFRRESGPTGTKVLVSLPLDPEGMERANAA